VVSCTEASWRFLGLSFAGWNAVVSLALVVLCLAGALARRRPAADL
jgi:disulfide bond formation protein DsbB